MSTLLLPNKTDIQNKTTEQERLIIDDIFLLADIIGVAGIEELAELGQELRDPSASLISKLDLTSSPLDPKNLQELSGVIPDSLIAISAYSDSFGSHLETEKRAHGVLTTPHLFIIAEQFAELTSGIMDDALAQADDQQSLPPIWTSFSPQRIRNFRAHQLEAYRHRLALQPGGREILHRLSHSAADAYGQKLQSLMGVIQLDSLRSLGRGKLSLLRAIGKAAASASFDSLDPQEFFTRPFEGLITENGELVTLPGNLPATLSALHHQAWLKARALIAAQERVNVSGQHFKRIRPQSESIPYDLVRENADLLNGLTLVLQLGKLEDSLYNKIYESSPEDERIAGLSITQPPEQKPAEPKVLDWGKASIHQDLFEKWQGRIAEYEESLTAQEEQALEGVLHYSDQITGKVFDEKFISTLVSLRRLARGKSHLVSRLQIVGQEVIASHPELMELPDGKLVEGICNRTSDKGRSLLKFHQLEMNLTLKKLKLLVPDDMATVSRAVLYRDRDGVDSVYDELRRIVNLQKKPVVDEQYQQEGGVLGDHYFRDFFYEFVDHGNRLLVHHREPDSPEVTCFFMYYRPGHVPSTHHNVPGVLRRSQFDSYAELICSDPKRESGTNHRAFRAMVADLQTALADKSVGSANTANARQLRALRYLGHFPQILNTFKGLTDKGETTLYQPQVMPLTPGELRAIWLSEE